MPEFSPEPGKPEAEIFDLLVQHTEGFTAYQQWRLFATDGSPCEFHTLDSDCNN